MSIEDVAIVFNQHPFMADFADQAGTSRIDIALQRLRELALVTDEGIALYRRELKRPAT